ncbi:hypothetical protein [Dactylosporangium sp. NPDC050588]|uniref:WD40 repeat domain-containing protein n=1 Tax=Dactylosporangium sp. NPDC050588 TaxID=3157211 RepID=UPI0033F530F5
MNQFDAMLTLLRQGRNPGTRPDTDPWLPTWTAGEPLSPGLHQVHRLDGLPEGAHVDATHAWTLMSDKIHRVDRTTGEVRTVALEAQHGYSPDAVFLGGTLVTISKQQVLVWDTDTGKLLTATDPDDIPGPAGDLCALDAAGGFAVTGTRNGYLLAWDLTDGRRLAKVAGHDGYVNRVAVTTDEPASVLSLGGRPTAVRFWTLDGLRPVAGPADPGPDAARGAWTRLDGAQRAVTVDQDGVLRIWDPTTATVAARFSTCVGGSGGLAFADAAAVLASGRFARVVDLATGTDRGAVRTTFTSRADHVAVHGRTVLVTQGGHTEGLVNVLHLDGLEAVPPGDDSAGHRLEFHAAVPTTGGIAATGTDGLVRIFDAADGRQLGEPLGTQRYDHMGRRGLCRLTIDGREASPSRPGRSRC